MEKIKTTVRNKLGATKLQTYCTELNSTLERHAVYGKSVFLPDYLRVPFTRLRVMSHNLKIETGRWRRLRREQRVCQCDRESVQEEKHVLLVCPLTAHIRQRYHMLPLDSMNSLMGCNNGIDLCKFVKETLNVYVWTKLHKWIKTGAITQGAHIDCQSISQRLYPYIQRDYLRFIFSILFQCY